MFMLCVFSLKKYGYCRLEHGVYNISRMRESAAKRYKVFQIPVDWLLDSGYASQVISMKVMLILVACTKYSFRNRLIVYKIYMAHNLQIH